MSQNFSKSRQEAEIAFTNIQTRTALPNSVTEEIDLLDRQRQQKTERLRQARLEREQEAAAFGKSGVSKRLE
ncbi:hypothetical protein [Rhizobium sp. FKY42]|uniref:hypothetical protein n=1 Tax=Rhizobium sp. FKY42 TaxID=2562310 RepID=UPI0010C033DB|nr:hypothetical protein [Rhizobium sp. FKY42]